MRFSELTEFKINSDGVNEKYVNDLILSLVKCGYEVYESEDKKSVCFMAWLDDVVSNIDKIIDGENK